MTTFKFSELTFLFMHQQYPSSNFLKRVMAQFQSSNNQNIFLMSKRCLSVATEYERWIPSHFLISFQGFETKNRKEVVELFKYTLLLTIDNL